MNEETLTQKLTGQRAESELSDMYLSITNCAVNNLFFFCLIK